MTLELLDALGAQISPDIVEAMAQDTGASRPEVEAAVEHGKPAVLAGLARLGSSRRAAARLLDAAIVAYRSDLLDKLRRFRPQDARDLSTRGRSILEAIFGQRTIDVTVAVARASGARPEIVSGALANLAPIALAVLGREATTRSLDPPSLSHLLASDERTMLALAPRELGPALGVPPPSRPSTSRRAHALYMPHLPHVPWALIGAIAVALAVLGIDWSGTRVTPGPATASISLSPQAPTPAPAPAATRTPAPPAVPSPTAEPTSKTTIASAEMPLATPPLYEVHFGFDSTQIVGDDAATVRKIASALAGEPKTQIRLTGHGDGVASADAENQLGLERAANVRRMLVALGIDPSHVEIRAAGPAPGTAATPAASRAQDRRVDVSLVNE